MNFGARNRCDCVHPRSPVVGVKTLLAKSVGIVFSVAAGLPCGKEGSPTRNSPPPQFGPARVRDLHVDVYTYINTKYTKYIRYIIYIKYELWNFDI